VVSFLGTLTNDDLEALVSLARTGDDVETALSAAELLQKLGAVEERIVSELVSDLEGTDTERRLTAARMLAHLGRASERVVDELILAIGDPVGYAAGDVDAVLSYDFEIREELLDLAVMDPRIRSELIAALERTEIRVSAHDLLADLAQAEEDIVDELMAAFDVVASETRFFVADLLVGADRADERVVGELDAGLYAVDPGVRFRAAELLVRLDRVNDRVVDELLAGLQTDNRRMRWRAVEGLARSGRLDAHVIDPVVEWIAGLESVDGYAPRSLWTLLRDWSTFLGP
jgi:hypothetical protein